MGNFSRDPELRLADATAKHYVGNRVQQGVPMLDADLHLLEGLHRGELEGVGRWMLGNGVPVGTDAFRVVALAGGGVNTLVVKAKTVGTAQSTLAIDVAASSAAAALGFGPGNAWAGRFGNSPAQLTSSRAAPFQLAAGQALVIAADGGAPETVTFQTADFANIAAATATEVAAKITAAAARATSSAGDGNDFFLTGGDGTTAGAGRILVDGRMALIERGLRYSEQPLYRNAALAAQWGVDPIAAVPTPGLNQVQIVFIDVWHREVGSAEDGDMLDGRIGIETAVSLRREWAVRVTPSSSYAATLAAKPEGHSYYPLAELRRGANDKAITTTMTLDLRDTDVSLQREIAYRTAAGVLTVNTQRFRDMLLITRNSARDMVTYLTTDFVKPGEPYLAGEIAGMESLSTVATVADHGLAVLNARALGTMGALGIMQQLYDAEKRFVTTWKVAVLPLTKGGIKVYQTPFALALQLIEQYLDGPAPGGNVAISAALGVGNLDGAVTSQEGIAAELGDQSQKPSGAFTVKYLGSVTPQIQPGVEFDLRFEVTGTLTPGDDLVVKGFIDPSWSVTFKNQNGSTPFSMHVGPGAFTRQFLVGVTPPNVLGAKTLIGLEVSSKLNPGAVSFVTTQKKLQVGGAPPFTDDQYAFSVFLSSIPASGNVYEVPAGQLITFTFRLENTTTTPIVIDLLPGSAAWQNRALTLPITNRQIPARGPVNNGLRDFDWEFTAPAAGSTLIFELDAAQAGNHATLFATLVISLQSV